MEQHDRIPAALAARMNTEELAVSPMVRLELAYLHETGRLTKGAAAILDAVRTGPELTVGDTDVATVVAVAEHRMTFARDPFDRIIGARAIAADAELATADHGLRHHLDIAVWD